MECLRRQLVFFVCFFFPCLILPSSSHQVNNMPVSVNVSNTSLLFISERNDGPAFLITSTDFVCLSGKKFKDQVLLLFSSFVGNVSYLQNPRDFILHIVQCLSFHRFPFDPQMLMLMLNKKILADKEKNYFQDDSPSVNKRFLRRNLFAFGLTDVLADKFEHHRCWHLNPSSLFSLSQN